MTKCYRSWSNTFQTHHCIRLLATTNRVQPTRNQRVAKRKRIPILIYSRADFHCLLFHVPHTHTQISKVCPSRSERHGLQHRLALQRRGFAVVSVVTGRCFIHYPIRRLLHCPCPAWIAHCLYEYELLLHAQLVDPLQVTGPGLWSRMARSNFRKCWTSFRKGI